MNETEINKLQEKLNYSFANQALLMEALRHSSYANENKINGAISNERLEFLGDSVLGMTVANLIYNCYPDMPEGRMTRLRAELVCEKSLASLADKLGLGTYLQLGRGEEKSGGRVRPSILADALEAVLAAMYLDGGFEPVAWLVSQYLEPKETLRDIQNTDFKTALQEIVQEKAGQTLSYHITDECGPDHMKLFTVEVRLNGRYLGSGIGKSKKEAEQIAAKEALEELSK